MYFCHHGGIFLDMATGHRLSLIFVSLFKQPVCILAHRKKVSHHIWLQTNLVLGRGFFIRSEQIERYGMELYCKTSQPFPCPLCHTALHKPHSSSFVPSLGFITRHPHSFTMLHRHCIVEFCGARVSLLFNLSNITRKTGYCASRKVGSCKFSKRKTKGMK